ncbi:low molecular weight protein-tyrosine-phosphatase [Microbulbifer sp. DLAB2-AA]|uniref:low molecular weight protein-tyrosine-phosphatase n=1 Tax=Microbulbifer sp. DLAB2-AA TaxID=3243394 RepID=UPI00403A285B
MNIKPRYSILFVCLGNICRSPLAESVFRTKAQLAGFSFLVDSAGIINQHVGERPDKRALKLGEDNGYSFRNFHARQVREGDFSRFDYILAMDNETLKSLKSLSPIQYQSKLYLFLDFAGDTTNKNIPDPYFGDSSDFKKTLSAIEQGVDLLIEKLKEENN